MIAKGLGSVFGGPLNGKVNDKFGGGRASSIATLISDFLAYSSLLICSVVD